MALRRLTSLEAGKLQEEADSLKSTIAGLEQLLANEKLVLDTVKRESQEIADKFGDERRTTVSAHALLWSAQLPCFEHEDLQDSHAPLPVPYALDTLKDMSTSEARRAQKFLWAYCTCRRLTHPCDLCTYLSLQIRAGVSGALSEEDIVPNRPSVLVFSRKGYIKRMPADLFATQVCLGL